MSIDLCYSITFFQARYQEHIESTYGTDSFNQLLAIKLVAYRYTVTEPNKGRCYGLGSILMAVCYHSLESCGSTFLRCKRSWVWCWYMSHAPKPDETFLCWLEDIETHEQDRQEEITRMREKMRAKVEALDLQLTQLRPDLAGGRSGPIGRDRIQPPSQLCLGTQIWLPPAKICRAQQAKSSRWRLAPADYPLYHMDPLNERSLCQSSCHLWQNF